MKCVICKNGDTTGGTATVTLTRESTVVVMKNVPAQVCSTCGEYYLDADVAANVYGVAADAARKGMELEVTQYAA